MIKKILVALLVMVLTSCSSTSDDQYIPNEDFVNSLLDTNNYLDENQSQITGDLYANFSVGAQYENSNAEVGVKSSAGKNYVYYGTNISASTFTSFLEGRVEREEIQSALSIVSGLTLYSKEGEKEVLKDVDFLENRIALNNEFLEKFYKTNTEYFSYNENLVNLGNTLTKYGITTTYRDNIHVTSITVPASELSKMIPFTDFELNDSDMEYTVNFYQEEQNGLINAIEIVLVDFNQTTDNEYAYIQGKVSIVLNLVPIPTTEVTE